MNDYRPPQAKAVVVDAERWGNPHHCAWCEQQYEIPENGLTLWVDYGFGSMRVCSEGCAIEVSRAIEQGLWPNGPYHNAKRLEQEAGSQ